ncbi:hypothetical protein Cpir12675_002560 [Ceratocystis pirilliformis]|uniref:tRNA (Guanine(10)-N2)-methyltransferase n=1 Tax=Ceratocystis pirilliformis TaxID=259994 RepID=A0ABR3Z8P5_9PEZI
MDFLVRFCQVHETFRIPELESLAVVEGVDLVIKNYREDVPFCIVTLPSPEDARRLIQRSILTQAIYEHWATASTIPDLLHAVKSYPETSKEVYQTASFKFSIDTFQGTRDRYAQRDIISSFLTQLPFSGPISMNSPGQEFTILEEWPYQSHANGVTAPTQAHFGRLVGTGARDLARIYDLKKRSWISTTSMDAELALVSANIALAGPGKLFYDPFCGTGSFPVAIAHFGALAFGSDIDGRPLRGKTPSKCVRGNFKQYGIQACFGDVFSADLTNSPIRVNNPREGLFDGIICDMPYGVREGLKVLGVKDTEKSSWLLEAGKKDVKAANYHPPTKPYSFFAMLTDILVFASQTLTKKGRLSFWMPAVDESDVEYPIPSHPQLQLLSVCTQQFNKWSRRLITYERLADEEVPKGALEKWEAELKQMQDVKGVTADELNPFRKSYFKGFQA